AATATGVADRLRVSGVGSAEPLAEAVAMSAADVAERLRTTGTRRAAPLDQLGSDMSNQDTKTTADAPEEALDEAADGAADEAAAMPEPASHADADADTDAPDEVSTVPKGGPVVAKANRFFNGKWIVFGLLLIAGGAWFAYDGFIGYPAENARIDELNELADQAKLDLELDQEAEYRLELKELGDRHSDNDLRFQVLLGFVLPLGGLALIGWTAWSARGQLRLDEDDVLHVPGHPPVPLSAITDIDDTRWEKKGVSRLAYEVDGKPGVIKLDDFIFDRPPTDQIHDRAVWVWKQGGSE
ncbi:MAG: hypothetical protein AAF743_04265, partial [Planctomycetota bacterium]